MKTITDITSHINTLISKSPTKVEGYFWTEILSITEAKRYDLRIGSDQELPIDFLLDVFSSYVEKTIASNLRKDETLLGKELVKNLTIFNKKLSQSMPIAEADVLINKNSLSILLAKDSYMISMLKPVLNLKIGVSFRDLIVSYRCYIITHKDKLFQVNAAKSIWKFLRMFLYRIIPDEGLVFEEDLLEALKIQLEFEKPKEKLDTEKIQELKQIVNVFNEIFGTKIKYGDVGLSYKELKSEYKDKDSQVRSESDENRLREFRRLAHYYFDKLWDGSDDTIKVKMGRQEAYRWLAKALGLPKEQVHFSHFSEVMCTKALLEVFHIMGKK